jgi:hypothetical protein
MGTQGKTGARGPRGKRGETGMIGRRGHIGKPGEKGLNAVRAPLNKDDILNAVVSHFDDVYRQLNEQMRRMTKIQQQVHVLIGREA